jgi:solute carrier family 36 (proton-coupled amino acid transporter)
LRSLILASIVISQIGFVCAGIVFTAENLLSFFLAVSKGSTPLSTNALIAIQLAMLIPLAIIRNISKLGPAALLADVCILVDLTYIWYYDISTIASHGLSKTVELFNPHHFTLTVGSAIFTFEGIGLLLPIQLSMREPEEFRRLLYIVMFLIAIIFTSVGALCYAVFGSKTQTEVISNFPQSSKLVNAVQFLYSLAVLVGTVLVCGVIAALGANDLDKFVALIGSFACVPLVYIHPALLHYRGTAESRLVAVGDILLMVVGLGAMMYTTSITLSEWIG